MHGTATTIHDLPVEILLIIFHDLYDDARCCVLEPYHGLRNRLSGAYSTRWSNHTDLRLPAIFPYSLANTCARWGAILIGVPDYWTRLVWFVDKGRSTPLERIKAELEWSGDLPIDVVVIRHDGPLNPGLAFLEGEEWSRAVAEALEIEDPAYVHDLTKLLVPHLHRCATIWYDVILNSSLPSLHRDFRGVATHLETFELHCRIDNAEDEEFDLEIELALQKKKEEEDESDWAFQCPNLRALGLNGRNYLHGVALEAHWIECIPELRSASIGVFMVIEPDDERLSHYSCLPSLLEIASTLRLAALDLDFDPAGCPLTLYFDMDQLTLEDWGGTLLDELENVSMLMPSTMVLIRCEFGTGLMTDKEFDLVLKDISTAVSLGPALSEWDGRRLAVERCVGFTDRVLDSLGSITESSSALQGTYNARSLCELSIIDCTTFSIGALKRMVLRRREAVKNPYSCVRMLRVLRLGGDRPHLTEEDVAWFEENVREFTLS
ncbi:hypothetical protein BDN72DRAFT_283178 [Pluteus cervinus]|uniref:Uncharacterized protein n=1 Tax=Pluteus cervinus TaxID=181527 RepID=A0ACD3B5B1_9AGAR|nr:hypothetical protein BDN72DRAFT_283178 [Pluteus cervinus]